MNRRLYLLYGLFALLLLIPLVGFNPATPRLRAEKAQPIGLDLNNTFAAASTSLSPAAASPGSISGRVFEGDGTSPIAGAYVSTFLTEGSSNFSRSTHSAPDGSYYLGSLYPGEYAVVASAESYLIEVYQENLFHTLATPVPVAESIDTPGINFTLDRGGSISGHVYYSNGTNPIPGARVYAYPDSNYFSAVSATTAVDGGFTLKTLYPVEYIVQANLDNRIPEYYNGTFNRNEAKPVQISGQSDITGIDFSLEAGGGIAGHIYQAGGLIPIAGAEVHAVLEDNIYGQQDYSSPDGSFLITALVPGKYAVRVSARDYISELYTETVAVANQTVRVGIDFTLDKKGSISGYVYEADTQIPISSIRIYATRTDADHRETGETALTQEDGSYCVTGLEPDEYRVYTRAQGYINQYYNGAAGENEAIWVVVVRETDTPDIDFNLKTGGSITGHVYEANGHTPIERAKVGILNMGSAYATTAADGSFIISSLPTGDFKVYASAQYYVPAYYNGAPYAEEASPVSVTAPGTAGNVAFILERSGSISGRVFGPDGKSLVVGDLNITAISEPAGTRPPPAISYGTPSPRFGFYTIPDIAPGYYQVRIDASRYIIEFYDGIYSAEKGPIEGAVWVKVESGQDTRDIDFTLEIGGSITGHVYEFGGMTPIAGATVSVEKVDGTYNSSATTRRDGSYVIAQLQRGKYLVSAYLSDHPKEYYLEVDFQSGATLIEVTAPGIISNIDFSLDYSNSGSISGHVSRPEAEGDVPLIIQAFDFRTHEVIKSTGPDNEDNYRLSNLPGGDYLVRVSGCDFGANLYESTTFIGIQWYKNVFREDKAIPVTVTSGEDTPGIDFILKAAGAISGHITNSNGPLPSNTKIEVFNSSRPGLYSFAYTNNGSYGAGGLPDGKYKVRVTSPGYACQWNGQAPSKQQAGEIVIHNSNTVAGVDFTLVPDTIKPTVVATLPVKDAVKVRVNSPVKITFSEEMETYSVQNGFFLYPPAIGKLDLDGKLLTFIPANKLAFGKTYTLTLASNIRDTAGNLLGAMSTWNFTTENWPTTVVTRASTVLGDTSARLNGTVVKPAGAANIEVFFEWGPTTAYGNTTPAQVMKKGTYFSFVLKDLLPETTYHFRAAARGDGTVYGKDSSFTTLSSYKLKLATSGQGTITPGAGTHVYLRGSTVEISAVPAAGWRFEKWMGGVTDPKAAATTVTLNRSKTVTAVFKKIIYYKLTLEIKGQGVVDPPAGIHSYAGTQVVIMASPAAGWKFSRWSGSASGTANPLTIVLKGNRKITANFVLAGITRVGNTQ